MKFFSADREGPPFGILVRIITAEYLPETQLAQQISLVSDIGPINVISDDQDNISARALRCRRSVNDMLGDHWLIGSCGFEAVVQPHYGDTSISPQTVASSIEKILRQPRTSHVVEPVYAAGEDQIVDDLVPLFVYVLVDHA